MEVIEQPPKEGFVNRVDQPLPDKQQVIEIYVTDSDGPHFHKCLWFPWNEAERKKYKEKGIRMPANGYLGTARMIDENGMGIGFHAWEQNKYEFQWYRLLK